ncbi:MAG: serine/threonine-protein kinase [Leptolyngbyaceae cyanobacterium bins.302]|nr:serine/threonine-protein kinase [Leptolyngbyaceae cyanobacterium bins.302]
MIGQLLTGRYLILEKLGAGGFSETYLARDKYLPHHPLCVAKCLKLSHSNTISISTAQRLFETEAQVLAELGQNHAQIPTLLAYSHDQEMAYQIQQYIEGENLGQAVAQGKRFNSEAAIALLLDVLPVLHYVHSHRVIHRDIKPSNLIQSTQENKVVLIDFGAARRMIRTAAGWKLDGEDADLAIGTPGYMPKEQQSGKLQFSSDLYALGASVIFLLTGVHPRKLQPNPISGELDWQVHLGETRIHPGLAVVLSGMVRCRARDRYQTAMDVLNAMQSFVSFMPADVPIKRPTISFQSSKKLLGWSNRVGRSLAIAGITLAMVGGGYYSARSNPSNNLITQMGSWFVPSSKQITPLHAIPVGASETPVGIAANDRHLVAIGSDRRLRVWSLPQATLTQTLPSHADQVLALSLSQKGEWLVSGDSDRSLHLWQLKSGKYQRQFTGHTAPITAVAVSSDGHSVASGSQDGTVRVWNCANRTRKQTLARFGSAITAIQYGITPEIIISANSQYELQIWNLQTRKLQRTFAGHTAPVIHLEMLDAETLVSVGQDRTLVWNLRREELVRSSAKHPAKLIAASVNERRVVTLNEQGNIQIWDADTGQTETRLSTGQSSLLATLSPTGRYLATWGNHHPLTLWQVSPNDE